jgi:hypothetical protein
VTKYDELLARMDRFDEKVAQLRKDCDETDKLFAEAMGLAKKESEDVPAAERKLRLVR